jgi:cell division protein FtsB
MVKPKIKPRSFTAGKSQKEENFFYRLIVNQRFLAMIGLIILVLIALPLAKNYSQKKIIEQELADLQANIQKFESETLELQEMLKYLESDQSLESQARLNLNLKKPGETVVVIEKDEDKKKSEISMANQESEKNNFQKWQEYFFK